MFLSLHVHPSCNCDSRVLSTLCQQQSPQLPRWKRLRCKANSRISIVGEAQILDLTPGPERNVAHQISSRARRRSGWAYPDHSEVTVTGAPPPPPPSSHGEVASDSRILTVSEGVLHEPRLEPVPWKIGNWSAAALDGPDPAAVGTRCGRSRLGGGRILPEPQPLGAVAGAGERSGHR